MSSRTLSFVADAATVALLDRLKGDLAAPTNADVFRKALALARVACIQGRDSDGVVVVGGDGPNGGVTIDLRG